MIGKFLINSMNMNRILGWSLITLCVFFFMVFGIMVYSLYTTFDTDLDLTANNIFAILASVIIFPTLFITKYNL